MRHSRFSSLGKAGVAVAVASLAAACVDLFHSTDFTNETDEADGSPVTIKHDAGSDAAVTKDAAGGPTICTTDETSGAAPAARACAWLSGCASAPGDNAPSACLARARSVFICQAAPERPAQGAMRALWSCLASATSCGDVAACLEPGGAANCSSSSTADFLLCENSASGSAAANSAVLVSCPAGSATSNGKESCALSGQTCISPGAGPSCGESTSCTASGCTAGSSVLHDCDDAGVDRGFDCANFGADDAHPSSCALDPTSGAFGCTTSGASCTATTAVTCDGSGVAHGCPSGTMESVDCTALTGSPTCNPAAAGPVWDVSRACVSATPCEESCTSGVVTACVGGSPVKIDCKAAGLSSCMYTSVAGENHPVCLP